MIENLDAQQFNAFTFRIASDLDFSEYISQLGLSDDPQAIQEVLELASQNIVTEPNSIVEKTFSYAPNLNFGTRFSDGSYCLYYCALELETAIKEVSYHFKNKVETEDSPHIAYLRILNCNFNGMVKDLVSLKEQFPFLVSIGSDGYKDCWEIAQEAINQNLDALIVPSARNYEGRCLPVFNGSPLTDASFNQAIVFRYIPETSSVNVTLEEVVD